MEVWKHAGALCTGIAALMTAAISLFAYLNDLNKTNVNQIQKLRSSQVSISKQYGVVVDPDGWVNLRATPSIESKVIIKIENGYKVEIIERNGNWFKVKTSIGDIGFIYFDRLKIISDLNF